MDEHDRAASLQLEAHLARVWPAIERVRVGGFECRFGDGYGRRSNSARIDRAHDGPRDLAPVEAAYRARGLPPIVQLADGLDEATWADALAARGYLASEPFVVCARRADGAPEHVHETEVDVSIRALDPAADARTLAALGGAKGAEASALGRLLAHADHEGRFVVARRDGALAAAIVFRDASIASIHELVTAGPARRRGLARAVVAASIADAAHAGAHTVAAQIAASNAASLALFEGLGFRLRYRYRYFAGTGRAGGARDDAHPVPSSR